MRLGFGILFRERPEISEPRSDKDRRDRQLRSLRTAGRHRLHHALELPALAMHPVRSTRFNGGQYDSLQTLQHNTPVRTGPPERLRVNRIHPRMLQHCSRKRASSQLPNRIRHRRYIVHGQRHRGTNGSSISEQSVEEIRSRAGRQRPLHSS